MNSGKIRFSCLHTHTSFCDGKGEVEDFCQSAWKMGLHSLGFSAHAPITKKTGLPDPCWAEKEQRLDKYMETVSSAKRRWEGRLKIFLGLEVDFLPGLMGPADNDYRELGLDYIIGSVHFVMPPKGAPFAVDHRPEKLEQGIREGYGGDPLPMVEDYYNSVEAMIRGGGFDILGHPDLVKKNNDKLKLFREDSDFYKKRCKAVAGLAAQNKITIEVNTGSIIRGYFNSPYPSQVMLKLFRENNVPAVINADAHRPEHLGGYYEEGVKALLAAGYDEMFLFEGRNPPENRAGKPGSPVWQKVSIAGILP